MVTCRVPAALVSPRQRWSRTVSESLRRGRDTTPPRCTSKHSASPSQPCSELGLTLRDRRLSLVSSDHERLVPQHRLNRHCAQPPALHLTYTATQKLRYSGDACLVFVMETSSRTGNSAYHFKATSFDRTGEAYLQSASRFITSICAASPPLQSRTYRLAAPARTAKVAAENRPRDASQL